MCLLCKLLDYTCIWPSSEPRLFIPITLPWLQTAVITKVVIGGRTMVSDVFTIHVQWIVINTLADFFYVDTQWLYQNCILNIKLYANFSYRLHFPIMLLIPYRPQFLTCRPLIRQHFLVVLCVLSPYFVLVNIRT